MNRLIIAVQSGPSVTISTFIDRRRNRLREYRNVSRESLMRVSKLMRKEDWDVQAWTGGSLGWSAIPRPREGL